MGVFSIPLWKTRFQIIFLDGRVFFVLGRVLPSLCKMEQESRLYYSRIHT